MGLPPDKAVESVLQPDDPPRDLRIQEPVVPLALDVCYYRIDRGETQLGSTLATMFDTDSAWAFREYRVQAVDQEGNAGP